MVFLAISPRALEEALATTGPADAVWCSADAISEEAYRALLAQRLTRFTHSLVGAERDARLTQDLETIAQHHPGQTVWVEAPSSECCGRRAYRFRSRSGATSSIWSTNRSWPSK